VRGLLRRHFQGIGQPFLWVVDDLPPIERTGALAPWLAPHELGRTLITTRARLIESVKPIDLQQLEPDEALRLLTRGQTLSDEDAATARAICAELGCHALAIDVTAALIRRRGYAKVLENLRQPDRDALEFAATQFREALPNGHERSIAATLLASLRELDEPARDLLRLASVLAAAPIPRDLQWRSLQYINDKKFHFKKLLPRLFKKSRVTQSAAEIQDITDSAAAQLIDTSLADDAGPEGFSIHTLIARTIRFSEKHSKQTAAIRAAAIRTLLTEMPRAHDIHQHPMIKNLIPHAQHIGESLENEDATNLLGWTGRYYLEQGQYNQSQSIYSLQLERRKRSLGIDHPETLAAMNNLAGALGGQGNHDKAGQLQAQVIDIISKKLGDKHPDTLSIINNLAVTLANQGKSQKAQELFQTVLEGRKESLGEDHPDTMRSILNLGQTLHQNN
jgi:tetratricopeptide (TPR) repeat protein